MAIQKFLARQAYKPSGLFGSFIAGRVFNKTNSNLEDMALSRMSVQENSRILEIGFGNGRLIGKIGRLLQTGRVDGIEISEPMLRQAEKNNRRLIEKGVVALQEGSVENLPYEDGTFDMVVTHNTIYFWPDPAGNIQEVRRVLKPGGAFYCGIRPKEQMKNVSVMQQNRDVFRNMFSEDEIRRFLTDAGLSGVSVERQKDHPMDNMLVTARK